jgi:hypothetical protein
MGPQKYFYDADQKRHIIEMFENDSPSEPDAMTLLNLISLGLLVLSAQLFAANRLDQSPPDPVGVYISFDGPHSDRAVDAMKQEVEALVNPTGFQLQWRLLEHRRSDESFSNLVVVKIHGKCDMADIQAGIQQRAEEEDVVLGSTNISDGQILPFSDLECDRIRRSIAPLATANSSADKESLLGRAMGRVLAHELFHVFGNTVRHGREGVAKTSFTRHDLVADRFKFDVKDAGLMERH